MPPSLCYRASLVWPVEVWVGGCLSKLDVARASDGAAERIIAVCWGDVRLRAWQPWLMACKAVSFSFLVAAVPASCRRAGVQGVRLTGSGFWWEGGR